jgi:SAM-dependent methyltransferase
MDWQATQNQEYLFLLERRLREPRLIWVDQFVEIINNLIDKKGLNFNLLVNDFGCNVGHLYRGIQVINGIIDYCGYDISDTYLEIARKYFPEANFINFDISGMVAPRTADIAVISATLEHIDNHQTAIKNIFDTSRHMVIVRTFIGDVHICESCLTDGASDEYLIKQFNIDDITLYPNEVGWHMTSVADSATEGKPKLVCNGRTIIRSQQIMVFTRNEK